MDDIRSPSRDAHNAAHGDAAASNDAIRGGQPMTATPTAAPITLIEAITHALAWELEHDPSVLVLGEDLPQASLTLAERPPGRRCGVVEPVMAPSWPTPVPEREATTC